MIRHQCVEIDMFDVKQEEREFKEHNLVLHLSGCNESELLLMQLRD